jgi:hypothetical protein
LLALFLYKYFSRKEKGAFVTTIERVAVWFELQTAKIAPCPGETLMRFDMPTKKMKGVNHEANQLR